MNLKSTVTSMPSQKMVLPSDKINYAMTCLSLQNTLSAILQMFRWVEIDSKPIMFTIKAILLDLLFSLFVIPLKSIPKSATLAY